MKKIIVLLIVVTTSLMAENKTLLQLLDEYGHQQLNENYGLNPKSRNYKYKAKMDIAASNQNLAEDREAERALDGANANDTYMPNN